MRVLLISTSNERINMTVLPLGPACMAEAARIAGHEVKLLNLTAHEEAGEALTGAIESFAPEVIGVSVRNIDDQTMEKPRFLLAAAKGVVDHCRSLTSVPVVLGGAGYSIFPSEILEFLGADLGVQGEGEIAFPLLLRRLEKGEDLRGTPGLYVRGRGLQGSPYFKRDLDEIPLPSPDLLASGNLKKGEKPWLPFQTRRGCPLRCSYCSTSAIEGCLLRKRSVSRVVEGLSTYARAGLDQIFFVDNTFNLPPSFAENLCDAITEAGLRLKWRCIFYPRLRDGLVEKMAVAGCEEVSLGFESGSPMVLQAFNKRFRPEEVRAVSRELKENGIRQTGFLLLGGPGETRETVLESLEFADSLALDAVKVTVGIRIYPGTALAKTAVEEKIIAEGESLLYPRFYIRPELAAWLKDTVATWLERRPHWVS